MPTPTEQEIRAFVGNNSGYYLSRWSAFLSGEGNESGFNVAAFLISGLWLPYRKMYKITLIFYGIIVAESILEYILFVGILNYEEPPVVLSNILGIALAMICGVYGNRWYYSHTCNKIDRLRRLNLSEESLKQALRRCGGTSWFAAVGYLMMSLIVLMVTLGTIIVLLGLD
ncbi:MAG TPA: hypothetical protein DEG17_24325 [Cyanobacteria bacterium UBA11149]|nr:hypothetical protein [Cyanobacteria bacterium UBA11367]HBE58519.1 hypothetical protein [Cyanobacteria bacterium UBA11366]HBK65325.1 hypothetical protein [Cyanobacteria bacterium UBA11166]HBR72442.1 hypothetical protein [Cyanobacteria bacterium UBA11159]HBS69461.1 hypothetical protein [Cyanobacteria bacterium UBA11153]HBW91906.1 hypothetical protein [Cyanobacteria bacterium UBA11149]HCA98096.1 hypothetical protein [Cyanobacteria bacterium UBA9226]